MGKVNWIIIFQITRQILPLGVVSLCGEERRWSNAGGIYLCLGFDWPDHLVVTMCGKGLFCVTPSNKSMLAKSKPLREAFSSC